VTETAKNLYQSLLICFELNQLYILSSKTIFPICNCHHYYIN
jgi:hypothetical protein